jgi:YidC/Oxa1 family membrane protein insertase
VDRNFLLAMALSFVVLSLWMTWQKPPEGTEGYPQGEIAGQAAPKEVPTPLPGSEPFAVSPTQGPSLVAPIPQEGERVRIELPLYTASFSTLGAGLLDWELSRYHDASGSPVEFTTDDRQLALATPFSELGVGDFARERFALERPSAHTLLFSRSLGGVTVRKTYELDPDSYALRLRLEVENGSAAVIAPSFAVVWPARVREGADFIEQSLVALQQGSVRKTPVSSLGSPGFFGGLFGGGAGETQLFTGDVEWAGVATRYFLAAIVTDVPRLARVRFIPVERADSGLTVLDFAPESVPPGHRASRDLRVYVGPKEPARLDALGANLGRAINRGYSWVAPLTQFFTWLMHAAYQWIPNYGVVIILITIAVRIVTAPLTAKQMRSMKRLSTLQPKMKELQEKYGDDRARMQQEMMALYQREGVNPLTAMGGGCLPMLLQFPVFIGLYFALQSSIELRQASFVWWIDDLSAPETLFMVPGLGLPVRLLPLLMGASMVLQQKLTPMTTADPAQARMMTTIMPVMFTVLFYQFPSGLVLYWLVSNLLAIGHQAWMNRGVPSQAQPAKPAAATRSGGRRVRSEN